MDELFSIEVFVRKVYSIDVDCHLPSLSFRLLDFPAQTIYITSPERIAKIQNKIAECPDYLTELEKLRNSNGDIVFNKGKSCLFPLSFESAQSQLSEIPLFLVLTDDVTKKPKYLGSIGISLAKLMDSLREKTSADPTTICNDALRGSYPIKSLMGTRVAKLAVEVKLFYYGHNLVHHIPALSNVAEKSHESTLGVSSHLKSEEDVISVMEDIRSPPPPPLHDSTPEIPTPDSVDSEKERDETDLNPPPLFYQAPLTKDDVENKLSRDSNKSAIKSHQRVASPKRYSSTLDHQVPSDIMSPVDHGPVMSPVNRRSSDVDLQGRGYDPKKFDLIRAVLTELTYLTDFLDPKLVPNGSELSGGPSNNQLVNELRKPTAPKTPKVKKPQKPRVLGIGKYGLTNSYILRLSRLGPEKASEVLSKHLDKQSVSSIMDKLFSTPSTARKTVEPAVVVKKAAKPTLVSTESQTDTLPTPRVAWQDQGPVSSSTNKRIDSSTYSPDSFNRLSGGTAPFTVIQGGQTLASNHLQSTNSSTMAQVLAAMQALANTVSLDGDARVMSPTRQVVSPMRDAMSRESRAGSSSVHADRRFSGSPHKDHQHERPDVQSRLSRHSSLRRASSMQEYNYSDNFEEPSCVSLNAVSPGGGRPLSRVATHSRLSMRDLVVEEDAPESGRTGATLSRRSSRNTRYEKRSNSLKTRAEEEDSSSSTTSTAGSTTYVSPRRFRDSTCSRKSQTSPAGSDSTAAPPILQRSNSVNSAVSIACQTPALSRTHSTQTQAVSESDESVMTVLPSPTRDMPPSPAEVPSDEACATARHDGAASDQAISSHSSLESGSIYIGSDTDCEEEGEEDPLQLSYLLSTESVQFSDEDQPTSLLKLCSPSEARAVNKFMYTF